MAGPNERPGISGHPQADSLGDRGEFDEDNSGGGSFTSVCLIASCTSRVPSGARGLLIRTRVSRWQQDAVAEARSRRVSRKW
jgi:hypothetical protein